jgi:organic hydroperoxide reductase OsmC/OhrA
MMGTLATVLAGKKIPTFGDRFRADVEGDIEDVDGVLRITRIRVRYTLKAPSGKAEEARDAMKTYVTRCPAAMSVRGCIALEDSLVVSELDG